MALNGPPQKILPEVSSIIGKSNNARAGFEGVKTAFKNAKGIDSTINAVNSALAYGNWLASLFNKGTQSPGLVRAVKKNRFSYLDMGNLLSQINRYGLSKTNKFAVYIGDYKGREKISRRMPVLDANQILGVTITSGSSLLCEAIEFPGRSFEFTDAIVYGPAYKMPYASNYQEITMTFLCDNALNQKRYFDDWMDYINPSDTFDFRYREEYTTDIFITQLDDLSNQRYSCKLVEAFPTAVQPLSASWSDDQFHKVQVTMSYRYWAVDDNNPELIEEQPITDLKGVPINPIK